jgi:ferredoxin
VIVFFLLPLIAALFTGRTFCAAVCPLGAIQDAVVLKPARVPHWLAKALGILPAVYLGLAVLLAVTGAGYVICQYDPFIGFFRFGADFNMVLFGSSMLLLGTVVARPYCRFLCPYGVLLGWMSRLSRRHARITPDECNNCRLCEESCPFGAIRKPLNPPPAPVKNSDVKRLASLFLLLPVVAAACGWIGSRLDVPLSRLHPKVSLAEIVLQENAGRQPVVTDPLKAFKASGKPTEELMAEAAALRRKFRTGGWILGGFVGFMVWVELTGLFIRKRRPEYEMDRGTCLSCGRCFAYCPYEQVRLGRMTPEEVRKLDRREIQPKQFRA